jgi:hypothetical protein
MENINKPAYLVGDCFKSFEPMTQIGNVIVVGRKSVNENTVYTLFTDFGNTITRTEEQLTKHFNRFNHCDVNDWLQDRNRLIAEQYHEYMQSTSIL